MAWVRAGHDPAMLYNPKNNDVILLDKRGGLPIGIAKDSVYVESVSNFEPGSIMVLISDGITETRNGSGEFYGRERVRDILLKHVDESSKTILNKVLESVEQFGGNGVKHDDITIIVIKAL